MTSLFDARSIDDVRQHVMDSESVRATGGGTKSAVCSSATISLARMSGVLEYNPSEFTFTALAGTPLAEIDAMLAEHSQFMPFDPPLVKSGGTIAGTVAAGLSGPGRFRFGGVRDFFLGVKMVTGTGRVVFGGGKVVKNAAGFDFPKLMVGSLGTLAIMTELTFKVFPAPEAYRTLRIATPDLAAAIDLVTRLSQAPIELYGLDIDSDRTVLVRAAGLAAALNDRVERVKQIANAPSEVIEDEGDKRLWEDVREFRWLADNQHLVKLPMTPDMIPRLDEALDRASSNVTRRYSVAGNLAWLGWPADADWEGLNSICHSLGQPALVLTGSCHEPVIDPRPQSPLLDRLVSEFDPQGKLRRGSQK